MRCVAASKDSSPIDGFSSEEIGMNMKFNSVVCHEDNIRASNDAVIVGGNEGLHGGSELGRKDVV